MTRIKRRGFTLIELLTGIIVFFIIAGVSTLSFNFGKQTPKREAEKILSRIYNMTLKANKIHQNFKMTVQEKEISFSWQKANSGEEFDTPYKVSDGLTLEPHFSSSNVLSYTYSDNDFNHQGGTIFILDDKGNTCKIVIAVEGGRLRIEE